jgi:hypothetical protein
MQIPFEVAFLIAAGLSLVLGLVIQVKQMEIDHLREHVRLYMTNGGRQHVSAKEAAAWIAAGKVPASSCQGCTVKAEFKLRGADLVAATRLHDYRNLRTS